MSRCARFQPQTVEHPALDSRRLPTLFKPYDTTFLRRSWCHVDARGARLSVCPPPNSSHCPRTTVLVPLPSLRTEEYLRGHPTRLHPAGTPWPVLPDGLLNASRAPFRISPPSPYHGHLCLDPVKHFGKFAVICGPWVKPCHGNIPQDQVSALAKNGMNIIENVLNCDK